MKKVILMMILIFIFVSVEVNAVEPKYMCVYGDSITAGYGLKDNADNFADILKKKYHLAKGTDFFNYSVSGATSSATLKQIKNTNAKVLQKADTIIISAGGNDIIDSYGMVLSNIVEQYYKDDIENAGISLGYNSPVRAICQLSELHENEIVSKIFDECMNARDFYKDTVDDFNKNINEMVKNIKSFAAIMK